MKDLIENHIEEIKQITITDKAGKITTLTTPETICNYRKHLFHGNNIINIELKNGESEKHYVTSDEV